MDTSQAHGPAKNVLVDLWLLSTLATGLVDNALAGSPMSVDEFATYGLIVDLGPLSPADLARATGLAPTTLSGMLTRCERRGELERVPNPSDRRSVLLRLTDHGIKVYRAPVEHLRALLTKIDVATDGLPRDVRLALQRLDDALREVGGLDPRSYRLDIADALPSIHYSGPRLSARQHREVLSFVDWIRHRDLR